MDISDHSRVKRSVSLENVKEANERECIRAAECSTSVKLDAGKVVLPSKYYEKPLLSKISPKVPKQVAKLGEKRDNHMEKRPSDGAVKKLGDKGSCTERANGEVTNYEQTCAADQERTCAADKEQACAADMERTFAVDKERTCASGNEHCSLEKMDGSIEGTNTNK